MQEPLNQVKRHFMSVSVCVSGCVSVCSAGARWPLIGCGCVSAVLRLLWLKSRGWEGAGKKKKRRGLWVKGKIEVDRELQFPASPALSAGCV